MQGRRVPSTTAPWELEAGDYMVRDGYTWVRLPNAVGPCRLPIDKWPRSEHFDGRVTLDGSIKDIPADGSEGWHGYLENGVWREA